MKKLYYLASALSLICVAIFGVYHFTNNEKSKLFKANFAAMGQMMNEVPECDEGLYSCHCATNVDPAGNDAWGVLCDGCVNVQGELTGAYACCG